MKQRLMMLMAMLILMLALVPVVSAQDGADCFGLSADDCALADKASVNALQASSFFGQLDLAVTISGLDSLSMLLGPDAGVPGDITIAIQSSGPISLSGDGRPPQLEQSVNYSATVGTDTESGEMVLSIVDNIFYLQANDKVQGVDLTDELANPDASAMVDLNATNLAELLDLNPGDLSLQGAEASLPPSMTSYFTYTRDGDDFVFNVDISGLLASPEFADLVPMIAGLAGDQLGDMGAQDLQTFLPMLVAAIESNLAVTQSVDTSVPITNGFNINFHLSFDLGAMMGQPGSMDPVLVDMVLDFQMNQFNETFELSAPKGAEMVTPDELDFGFDLPSF